FVARTHDMERKHMMDTFRRAYEHQGASLVEVYQNCNVFNDGAFELITAKDARPRMLIPLEHGQPVRFGPDGEHGVCLEGGSARVVDVADVGEDALLVHDEHRDDPSLAFALSRLATGPTMPTPIGVFRDVTRPHYGGLVNRQLIEAAERKGPGDLAKLLSSASTWTVG
ncbi:MAG: 2-oxoacid:ferredoxin oxidoreductase subunit beta, partial [Acidimicrobiales bacterium]